jgi:hypothetical protein
MLEDKRAVRFPLNRYPFTRNSAENGKTENGITGNAQRVRRANANAL